MGSAVQEIEYDLGLDSEYGLGSRQRLTYSTQSLSVFVDIRLKRIENLTVRGECKAKDHI